MSDNDDLPGYLRDAFDAALDAGLLSLQLVRVGAGDAKMWQASTRFPKSSGYHVEILASPYDAMMHALGAHVRLAKGLDDSPASKALAAGGPRRHVLWRTADKDRPKPICDANGEVVLGQCKVCGMAEIELDMEPVCPGPREPDVKPEPSFVEDIKGDDPDLDVAALFD
jgi:hypothetical protein